MNVASALLVLAALGVNTGWQPVDRQPVRHTTRYTPSDPGPSSGDRYSYNSYDAAVGGRYQYNEPAATTSQPPSITGRVQDAVVETGTTLRDGIEAGIQAAGRGINQAGSRLMDRTSSVGQGVGQQVQDLAAGAGRQLEYTGDNLRNAAGQTVGAARDTLGATGQALGADSLPPLPELNGNTATSLPPWPADTTPAANPTTAGPPAGTSRPMAAPNVTPPPLAGPPAPAATMSTRAAPPAGDNRYGTNASTTNTDGWESSWPASAASATRPDTTAGGLAPIQNVPAGPALSGAPSSPPAGSADAAASWGNAGDSRAVIRRSSVPADRPSSDLGLVPVQSTSTQPRSQSSPPTSDRWADSWSGTDPWDQPTREPQQPSQPASSTQPVATPPAQGAPWPGTASGTGQSLDGWGDNSGTSSPTSVPTAAGAWPGNPAPSGPTATSPSQPTAAAPSPVATGPPAAPGAAGGPATTTTATASPSTPPAEQQPWLPLVLVSLGLAGSLGANLFLGWSYMESRHRYRVLAQKTADTFQRAKGLAA